MRYELTIAADNPAEIANILARLETGSPPRVPAPPLENPPPVASDDDDTGPVNESAPPHDKNNLPWDARIHAATKALTKEGVWRYRRGVAKELIESVEKELRDIPAFLRRTKGDAPAVPVAPVAAPVPAVPVVPVTEAPAPAPAAANAVDYAQIVAMLTDAFKAQKLTPQGMPAFWQSIGVTGVADLNGNQAALDAAYAKIALL